MENYTYYVIGRKDKAKISCNPEDFFGEGCRNVINPNKRGYITNIFTCFNGTNQTLDLFRPQEDTKAMKELSKVLRNKK